MAALGQSLATHGTSEGRNDMNECDGRPRKKQNSRAGYLAYGSYCPPAPALTPLYTSLLKTLQASGSSLCRIWLPYKQHGLLASWAWKNFRILVSGISSQLFSCLGFDLAQGLCCLLNGISRYRILKAFLFFILFYFI